MRESRVEGAVVKWARGRGAIALKLNLIGSTGWPDRLFLAPGGRLAFVEFKRPDQPAVGERNQPARIGLLQRFGFNVGIFNNVDEAIAFLEAALFSD